MHDFLRVGMPSITQMEANGLSMLASDPMELEWDINSSTS